MTIDEDPRLAEGIRLFQEGRFFASHEVLEDLWRERCGPEKEFLQGLIQVAVAHLHAERENGHGARALAASARRHLEPFGLGYFGIDLVSIRHGLDRLEASFGGA